MQWWAGRENTLSAHAVFESRVPKSAGCCLIGVFESCFDRVVGSLWRTSDVCRKFRLWNSGGRHGLFYVGPRINQRRPESNLHSHHHPTPASPHPRRPSPISRRLQNNSEIYRPNSVNIFFKSPLNPRETRVDFSAKCRRNQFIHPGSHLIPEASKGQGAVDRAEAAD